MNMKRDSKIELLRIVSILLVLCSHCISHSNGNSGLLLNPDSNITWNHFFSVLVGTWGRLAVEIFVFISAYYTVDKKDGFRSKKVLKIGVQTWFYCVVITCFVYSFHLRRVSITDIAKELLTPAYPQYWFITNYILFYLLMPFLQIFASSLNVSQLKCLVIVLTCIIGGFRMTEGVSNLVYFGYIFIIAALLKRNGEWFEKRRKMILLTAFLLSICLKFIIYDFDIFTGDRLPTAAISGLQMILGFITSIMAIALFYVFKNFNRRFLIQSEAINRLSRTTLGVYILHENILLRGNDGQSALIWDNIFHIGNTFFSSALFLPRVILAVTIVYIVCVFIENLRIEVIDKRIIDNIGWLDRICKKIDKYFR